MINHRNGRPTVALLCMLALGACKKDEPRPPVWNVGTVVAWVDQGVLAEVEAPYGLVRIVRLRGTHYEMGYQYGYLLHEQIAALWTDVFMTWVGAETGLDPENAEGIFGVFMDQAWGHMEPHTPAIYLDELEGVADGAAAAGAADPERIAWMVRSILMLADTSQAVEVGDDLVEMNRFYSQGHSDAFEAYFGIAEASRASDEAEDARLALEGRYVPRIVRESVARAIPALACSFFAVWGDRTDGGQLASRLLDWASDIGLTGFRLITVFEPDGGAAHVTVGYVGFMGALAGMSVNGIAISHVGAANVHERLRAEPGTLKSREILEFATNLDEGLGYLSSTVDDGILRPGTIGANAMLAFGDPEGGGVAAEAAAAETTGIFSSAFRTGPAPVCTPTAELLEFGLDGHLANQWDQATSPEVVNLESDAVEIDREGQVRTFQVDGEGQFVLDATGLLIDDPTGLPYPTGKVLSCALYRGDEAMAYGVRRWQLAANGPQREGTGNYLHRSGTYNHRYLPMHDMLDAYYRGVEYQHESEVVIPDNGGQRTPIGVAQAKEIARIAGMDGNVFGVIYDTTNLVLHVAYESGSGATWTRAVDNAYLELKLSDLLIPR